jgi:hypothetical protein
MKIIDLSALMAQGYQEAPEWDKNFGTRYGWANLVIAAVFFGALIVLAADKISVGVAGLVLLVSMVSILVLWTLFRHSLPVSPITGRRMVRYATGRPRAGGAIVEIVYVDHDSKTFFRHVFVENASTAP